MVGSSPDTGWENVHFIQKVSKKEKAWEHVFLRASELT